MVEQQLPILVTAREAQELLLHLGAVPGWTKLDENGLAWVHEASELAFQLAESPDPQMLKVLPVSPADAHEKLEKLLSSWTIYGRRVQLEKFLEGLEIEDFGGKVSSPGDLSRRILELEPPSQVWPEPVPQSSTRTDGHIALFQFVGGGYLRLVLFQGHLHATISAPDKNQNSYGPTLEGIVRPYDGRVLDVAAAIAGWEDTATWWTREDQDVCPECALLRRVPASGRRPPHPHCKNPNGCRCRVEEP